MKRNKSVFPALLFAIVMALLLAACAVTSKLSVGEELCSVVCASVGGKFVYLNDHQCVCALELPTVKPIVPATSNDNPKGTSL